MTLPRFFVLKSDYNGKYLRYIDKDVQVPRFLQFSGEEVVSSYAKYKVEMAKSGNGLVHIRCCYNNKYWVRWTRSHWWIVAGADEPEEDQSKWSCTLFEPLYVDADAKTIRLRHVQLGHYACLWRVVPPHKDCLFAGSAETDKDGCDVCTIIDWESLSCTETSSSTTLNASVSLKLGVNTSIQTGVPLIGEGKIEISSEFTVPPMTMVKVSLLATESSCDVSFSYSQRETLTNGQQITYLMGETKQENETEQEKL